jgi:hypothetical protein
MKAFIKDGFKDLLEYRDWVNRTFNNIQVNQGATEYFTKEQSESHLKNKTWFGEGTSYNELSSGVTEYKKPELISKIYNSLQHSLSAQTKDIHKFKKMRYNPYGLGMFSFDKAAMGMYRLKEFYSPSNSSIVEKEQVDTSMQPFRFLLDSSEVIQRWEQKPDGKLKIRTNSKNVYAYFPKVKKENRAAELFLCCGGSAARTADQMLYSGMSALIIAQLLEKAGVKTKISIVVGSSPDNYQDTVYAAIVPVKNYDENLDINLIALLTSDPRFFRWDGFKGIIAAYDHFKRVIPFSFGSAMTRETLIKSIEKSDYAEGKNIPANRFYFGGTYSEKEATDEISRLVSEITNKMELN